MVRRIVIWTAGVALVACVGAWVVSCFYDVLSIAPTRGWCVGLIEGCFFCQWSGLPQNASLPRWWLTLSDGFDLEWWPYCGSAMLELPLWIPAAFATAALVPAVIRERRARALAKVGRCPSCDYDLTGITGPCPECGSEA